MVSQTRTIFYLTAQSQSLVSKVIHKMYFTEGVLQKNTLFYRLNIAEKTLRRQEYKSTKITSNHPLIRLEMQESKNTVNDTYLYNNQNQILKTAIHH